MREGDERKKEKQAGAGSSADIRIVAVLISLLDALGYSYFLANIFAQQGGRGPTKFWTLPYRGIC